MDLVKLDIKIPDKSISIRDNLNFLSLINGFKSFLFYGPCIIKNNYDLKHIDIVLWFDSLSSLQNSDCIKKIPEKIDNLFINYSFVFGETLNVPYIALDPVNHKLYITDWFNSLIRSYPSILKTELIKTNIDKPIKQENNWEKTKLSWSRASSFLKSIESRGILSTSKQLIGLNNDEGIRVDSKILEIRKKSCFGDKDNSPCIFLRKVSDNESYCGQCGCGKTELSRLTPLEGQTYSKLDYPYLECPMKRPGFSNEEKKN